MTDKRFFVQFSHPGDEHKPDGNGKIDWNKIHRNHKRKCMQFRGEWIERDGSRHTGDLRAWGEWEPESDIIPEFNTQERSPRHPRYLWDPHYALRNCYEDLHNTDPFIFGDRFLYSNCGQLSRSKRGLKHLDQGSLIAFGNGRMVDGKRKWALDTVLAIRDSFPYDPLDPRKALKGKVPNAFLSVTGGPLTADRNLPDDPEERGLRLYRGATPNDPVHGMFSFFPAIPASSNSGFPRPFISLKSDYFNPRSWQAPKGVKRNRTPDELRCLWNELVAQVRDAGLVLGIHAEMPRMKG